MSAGTSADPSCGCVVVGAGPAGLATAAALAARGVPCTVLEQGDAVGAAWRSRYDRLRLNTSRLTSRVGGAAYPRGAALFPTRDEFVSHLEGFAERHGIRPRTGVRVERIDAGEGAWSVRTSSGDLHARDVVVASGYAREPRIPEWPGRRAFRGRLLHASEYRDPAPFRGADVLVAGAGSSGMEIAYDLAEGGARRVRLAVRTPPNILLRSVGGLPGDPLGVVMARLPPRVVDGQLRLMRRLTLGDLGAYGLPIPDEGPFARLGRLGVSPAVVDREVVAAIRQRRIEVVPGVEAFEGGAVRLAGGGAVEPDAVVAATGYGTGLEAMVGHLGVLDERGVPLVAGGREALPGLRFVGFVPVPGQIRLAGVEAARAAREMARRERRRPRATGAGRPLASRAGQPP